MAINAQLLTPTSVAIDTASNIYIAEDLNNSIRKIDAKTNIITTIAGTGTSGYTGDGGLAVNAQLYSPSGLAIDRVGNIYFADRFNFCVRKISIATGLITTIVGTGTYGYTGDNGLATNAKISDCSSVAVDTFNNIYIADYSNRRIRKIIASTGVITTIVGTSTFGSTGDNGLATNATLSIPRSIFIDISGNLFIADNNVIRKVAASTGIITTIIGNGMSGYSGDGGIAIAAQLNTVQCVWGDALNNYYIIDNFSRVIRKINGVTGIISTILGSPLAGFGDGNLAINSNIISPSGIAIDASDNLFIADFGVNRVRKITPTSGIISSIGGTGTYGFFGDGSSAISAQLKNPNSIKIDRSGNIYFIDANNIRIRKIAAASGNINTVIGNGSAGYFGDGGLATSAQISSPRRIDLDTLGNIYIADTYNNRIRKITVSSGIITTIAGTGLTGNTADGILATSALVYNPNGIAIDKFGNVYVSELSNRIRKIDKSTGIITTIAGNGTRGFSGDGGLAINAQLANPGAIILDTLGNIYLCDIANNCVRKISVVTGNISTIAGIGGVSGYSSDGGLAINARLSFIQDLTIDKAGNLYIVESLNNRIRKVSNVVTLPLNLLTFTAQQQSSNIALAWQTTNEVNTSHFIVQRSVDGTTFTAIGKVATKGGGSYGYTDDLSTINNQPPTVYYRLQMVDKDGSFIYSKVVAVSLNSKLQTLNLYPNPVKETLFVQLTSAKAEKLTLQVTDMQGKVLQQQEVQVGVGNTSTSINTTALAKGSYVLLIKGAALLEQKQFVKE